MYLKINYKRETLVVKSAKNQWQFTRENLSVATLILFYFVGIVGLTLPIRDAFVLFSPFNLLLSLGLVLYNHKEWTKQFIAVSAFCFLGGYAAEVIGVQTGMLFGNYEYGQSLGFKILDVPIILGVNWLMLIYASAMVVHLFFKRFPLLLKAALATFFMVALDILIEPVAMQLDFWSWENGVIPLQNFIGWFVVAYVLQIAFFKFLPPKANNHVAVALFGLQVIFFGVLNFVL